MAILKTAAEIEIMTEGGRRLAQILKTLKEGTQAGLTTNSLDELSFNLIKKSGAEPAFLGYRPPGSHRSYPKTLCVSINETVVHGLPSERLIMTGDLVKLDLGLKYRGFFLDSALTFCVGQVESLAKKLIAVTSQALTLAIKKAKPGQTLGDIGWAVQSCVQSQQFSIVEMLTGHGIGRALHEDPAVFNLGRPQGGEELVAGMVLAIEPMVSASPPPSGGKVKEMPDGSFITRDGSLSAHFEHTVAITEHGPRILTQI
ncbi:MAG: type I methionyl aminopeptidase [Candidatus Liptonbacteria bacterium]|nr:type I methionyl aminopeptidase [Candidatus Liptonbacteria bacterium]